MLFSYSFNTCYLDRRHAQIIRQERTYSSSKNIIIFKKLIVGLVGVLVALSASLGLSKVVKDEIQVQPLLVNCFLTLINIYFVKSPKVLNCTRIFFKQKKDNILFLLSFYKRKRCSSKISPSPRQINR